MILRISAALVCLMMVVSTANGQCSSCSQGPAFGQSVSAPVYSSGVYTQPVSGYVSAPVQNAWAGTYTSAPLQSGCGSCGQTVVAPQAYASPVNMGCSSCAQPMMAQPACGACQSAAPMNTGCSSCAQPVSYGPAPAACGNGCASCAPNCNPCSVSVPTTRTRVISLGSRRNNRCCN